MAGAGFVRRLYPSEVNSVLADIARRLEADAELASQVDYRIERSPRPPPPYEEIGVLSSSASRLQLRGGVSSELSESGSGDGVLLDAGVLDRAMVNADIREAVSSSVGALLRDPVPGNQYTVSSVPSSGVRPGFVPCATSARWHVSAPSHYRMVSGRCYLALIKPMWREAACALLHSWPKMDDIVNLPATYFMKRNFLLDTELVATGPNGTTLRTNFLDAMLTNIRSREFTTFVPESLAIRYYTNRRQVSGTQPQRTDRLGGVVGATRRVRGRYHQARLTPPVYEYSPPMSYADAEEAMQYAFAQWGIPYTEFNVNAVVGLMVPHFVYTTSAKRPWHEVSLFYAGRTLSFVPFVYAVTSNGLVPNGVRRWVRSFRHGEVCKRMVAWLAQPENYSVAQYMAGKFDCPDRFSMYAFDCNSVIKHVKGCTRFIRRYLRRSKHDFFTLDKVYQVK